MQQLDSVLENWGLAIPFALSAVAYRFFLSADRKASGQARRAISGWFEPVSYDKAAVASALVETFDRLYARRLLSIQAFLRSAMITLVVTAAVVILIRPGKVAVLFTGGAHIGAPFWWALSLGLTANIISDYVSLFFIRHWLGAAGRTPIRALFVAPLVGAVIILLVYFAKSLVWVTAVPSDTLATDLYRGMQLDFWKIVHIAFLEISAELGRLRSHGMLLGALAVHLWLPLFALGMLSIKALNSFVWAISFMRWFLKQGRQHPYEAVGHVAAVIVFVVSALIHVLLR